MQKNPHTEKFSLPDLIWFQSLGHDEEWRLINQCP